jgi:hypothetical protein
MNKLMLAAGLALIAGSGLAQAREIAGGNGLGYVAKLVFDKKDTQPKRPPLVLKTGDPITPRGQEDYPVKVPATKSTAWSDPSSNPDRKTADIDAGYGRGPHSKWFLIDLNLLQKQGLKSVWVRVAVKRHNDGTGVETDADGNALPSDDDLIPALTVWRGYQDTGDGSLYGWYPNRFQKSQKTWWGVKLTPFTTPESPGYATAFELPDNALATVLGTVKLKANAPNFLTVAVGGDARDVTQRHDVNFQLEVDVKAKPPTPSTPPPPAPPVPAP